MHFLLLGAAMFAGGSYLEARSRFTRITITQDQVRQVSDNYRLQYGVSPTPQQLEALVDIMIKQEVFYREALKIGLDMNDEIIRRRLVQKYEFLRQDLTTSAEPTEVDLLDYYGKHLDRYRLPQTVTFVHAYFSTDLRGEEGAREAAVTAASGLNLPRASRAVDRGDRFPGPHDIAGLSREELARVFGSQGLAESVFDVEAGSWSPPLRSGFGWHTAYVSARQPSRQAAFEEVRHDLRRDYLEAQRNQRNDEAFAKLRQSFEIVRE